jgi:hypothetical protein
MVVILVVVSLVNLMVVLVAILGKFYDTDFVVIPLVLIVVVV